jgi:hypothetical protein
MCELAVTFSIFLHNGPYLQHNPVWKNRNVTGDFMRVDPLQVTVRQRDSPFLMLEAQQEH